MKMEARRINKFQLQDRICFGLVIDYVTPALTHCGDTL